MTGERLTVTGERIAVDETDGLTVKVHLSGDVLLNGWRFGVLMSPAMADQLADDLRQAAADARKVKGAM